MENIDNMDWLNDKINSMPHHNGIYKFICAFLGKKKLTYKQMYLLLFQLNKKKLGDDVKKIVFKELLEIYHFNENKYPIKL